MLMRPAPDAIIHSAKECDTDGSTPRWILADFDDTLAPGDSHAGLLRYILRRRIWPLLLLPVIALGGLIYLVPSQRRLGISLIWWAITLWLSPSVGASWCVPIAAPDSGCIVRLANCCKARGRAAG